MDAIHKFQHGFLLAGLFAAIYFLLIAGSALFRLEPLDLRDRRIYAGCLVGGLFFGLLMEFGYLIPHRSIVVPLFSLISLLVGLAIPFFRRKPPFTIAENCAVDVRNLGAECKWYKEKLGLHEVHNHREDDSGRPFTELSISNDSTFLSLVELEPGKSAEKRHVIFFAKNLEKAHQWLSGRGVAVEPTTTDSGGNRLFRFQDLEGNTIEVCVEPG